jgi:hypothetical protein
MRDSVSEVMHSFARRNTITNDYHVHTRVLLRRMFTAWVEWYVGGEYDAGKSFPTSLPAINHSSRIAQAVSGLHTSWMCQPRKVYWI